MGKGNEINLERNDDSVFDVPETRTLRTYSRPKPLNPLNGLNISNFNSNETVASLVGGKLRTK